MTLNSQKRTEPQAQTSVIVAVKKARVLRKFFVLLYWFPISKDFRFLWLVSQKRIASRQGVKLDNVTKR